MKNLSAMIAIVKPAIIPIYLKKGLNPYLLPKYKEINEISKVITNRSMTGLKISVPISPRLKPMNNGLNVPAILIKIKVLLLSIRTIRSSGLNFKLSVIIFNPIINIIA